MLCGCLDLRLLAARRPLQAQDKTSAWARAPVRCSVPRGAHEERQKGLQNQLPGERRRRGARPAAWAGVGWGGTARLAPLPHGLGADAPESQTFCSLVDCPYCDFGGAIGQATCGDATLGCAAADCDMSSGCRACPAGALLIEACLGVRVCVAEQVRTCGSRRRAAGERAAPRQHRCSPQLPCSPCSRAQALACKAGAGRDLVGCTACPAGLLRMPVDTTGERAVFGCFPTAQLACAGAAKAGVGCTTCPAGRYLAPLNTVSFTPRLAAPGAANWFALAARGAVPGSAHYNPGVRHCADCAADLSCAPGKCTPSGKCTACPPGRALYKGAGPQGAAVGRWRGGAGRRHPGAHGGRDTPLSPPAQPALPCPRAAPQATASTP